MADSKTTTTYDEESGVYVIEKKLVDDLKCNNDMEEDEVFEAGQNLEPEPEKALKDDDYVMKSPEACSTPVGKVIPSRKASLRRPFPLKPSVVERLRRRDSGFSTLLKATSVEVEEHAHYSEEEWDPQDTFYSEDANTHSCGTQTTTESKTERMLRLFSAAIADSSWDRDSIQKDVKFSEERLREEIRRSEERTQQTILDSQYKIQESMLRNTSRVSLTMNTATRDVKVAIAEEGTRVMREVYDAVDDNGDQIVARVNKNVDEVVKKEIRGGYFTAEVRKNIAIMELTKIAGSQVAKKLVKSDEAEGLFAETDKILRKLEQTVTTANSTLKATETIMAIMRYRMKVIHEGARKFWKEEDKNATREDDDNITK